MKMVRKPEGSDEFKSFTKGRTMANEQRCSLCGLWACEHIKAANKPDISLGEKVGQPLAEEKTFPSPVPRIRVTSAPSPSPGWLAARSAFLRKKDVDESIARVKVTDTDTTPSRVSFAALQQTGVRTRTAKEEADNTLYKISSTIPMGAPAETQRIIIPPPPKVPSIVGPNSPITNINDPATQDAWVNCNICKAKVLVKYLDEHQKMHIGTHATRTIARDTTSSAITVYNPPKNEKKDSSKPKLSPIEQYKFRQIGDVCAASSMSQDGRYSDMTVILWMKESTAVTNTYYAGGSSTSTYKDWERLTVHVVYDSMEDYYTVTTKLLKRSSYATFDNEENVPDRICLTPRELNEEIKRALLFFRISPKGAYKRFRKLFKQELKIDYDNKGRACIAQTENSEVLSERLKKSSFSSSDYTGHEYHGHGWSGD